MNEPNGLPQVWQLPPLTNEEFLWLRLASNFSVATLWSNEKMLVISTLSINKLILQIGPENMTKFIEDFNLKLAKILGDQAMMLDAEGNLKKPQHPERSHG